MHFNSFHGKIFSRSDVIITGMEKPLALIIEDERDIAALFRHVLDIAGYQTEIVMNGSEALARLAVIRPDILLLDLNLPGVSGGRILEQVRADKRLMTVPVVVVTGHSEMADNLPFEPDLVLLKPVNLDQLSNLVQRLQTTQGSMQELPWDKVTHLYNREFFKVRLAYSLERARQIGDHRFGALFVDIAPFELLQARLDETQLNTFLRSLAAHLKTLLRPTDTISYFEQGLFLILIEDASRENIPSKIAGRLEWELKKFLSPDLLIDGLQTFIGIILCDGSYPSADEIMSDIELACRLTRSEKKFMSYDRASLQASRAASSNK